MCVSKVLARDRLTLRSDTVACNSTPPPASFKVGGQYFDIPAVDLIYEINGTCYSNVGDILDDGREFLMGVAAQFNLLINYDVANSTLTFKTRDFT
jgi:hypothetical protein